VEVTVQAITLKQIEQPAEYPEAPEGVSEAVAAFWPIAWERIESYIAWRWAERDVEWRVQGCGEWSPPLTPVEIETVEIWSAADEDWIAVALDDFDATPGGGLYLNRVGPYRITAQAGDAGLAVPAMVEEAVRRLAGYMAASPGKPGATSERIEAGSISLSHSRSATWLAKALDNSGAADLLRKFRRA
jgi:hypothetical protein